MNQKIINSIYKYIEVLYKNNQKLIKLFGVDALDTFNDGTLDILSIIQDVPRLIPYSCNKKRKLYLIPDDGLLTYSKKLKNLLDEYQKILKNNKECLIKIKRIRNKCEHILHNVSLTSCYTGNNDWFRYTFKIRGHKYNIESKELISLFKSLNMLYNSLIIDMLKYAEKRNIDHPFYDHLQRINILGFNKLYDSGLLYEIGKSTIEL